MGDWRYFAERLNGDGTSTPLHPDLPLRGVSITEALSGPGALSGAIDPENLTLMGEDGQPIFREWSTAIWAEKDDEIRGGGILAHTSIEDSRLQLECQGFSGYLRDLPYTAEKFFVEADPLDIARHIWAHAQSQVAGNLGVELDSTTSPVRIGKELKQVEFDTQAGPVAFEAGPYKLAWWMTHNLQTNFDGLASDTPFEYREYASIRFDGSVGMRIRLGYPTIGQRRADMRFMVGENVHRVPSVEYPGDEFANAVLMLGAGEGRSMIRGDQSRADGRLRRVAVVQDKDIRSKSRAIGAAGRELALRRGEFAIADLQVLDHPNAQVGAFHAGDEIMIQGDLGWVDNRGGVWVRIVSKTITPDDPNTISMTVIRTDKIAS